MQYTLKYLGEWKRINVLLKVLKTTGMMDIMRRRKVAVKAKVRSCRVENCNIQRCCALSGALKNTRESQN